jgi:predicted transposase/invertase (TIGR01784 family)
MELAKTSPMMNKAVGVLMELNASQRRRMLAESREKARRDERARLKGAKEEGMILGKEEGIKIGKAQMCLELGIPVAEIAAKTGLSMEEIEQL